MHFYGWKYYFQIQKPTSANLAKYPRIRLMSSTIYEPQHRYSCRVHNTKLDVDNWRYCLGFPKIEVIKATLAHNTNIVHSQQAKTREYMRDYYKTRV